jgi:UDP-glucose 4-epimerase
MNVLLVGGFGYLGGRLATGLRARGHEVIVAGRRVKERPHQTTPSEPAFRVEKVDVLSDPSVLAEVMARTETEVIVDLAALDEIEAIRDPDLALRVSSEGVRKLLAAAKASGSPRFVFLSTFHVYGAQFPPAIDEDTATKASHPYAISHLAGEGYCRESNRTGGPVSVALRLSNGYGCPADLSVDRWTLAHNDFCRQAVEKGEIVLSSSGTQRRDIVWMDDVAEAVELVMKAPAESLGEAIFNVGGGKTITIFDLATIVSTRAEKLFGRAVPVSRPSAGTPSPDFVFSIERLRSLGFAPKDRLAEETDELLTRLEAAHGAAS